jgi:hypothetical protein
MQRSFVTSKGMRREIQKLLRSREYKTTRFSKHYRNNSSKKTNLQVATKGAKTKRTKGRRRLFPSDHKAIRIFSNSNPVIRTYTNKYFNQPLTFGDTEANKGTKELLPHWG